MAVHVLVCWLLLCAAKHDQLWLHREASASPHQLFLAISWLSSFLHRLVLWDNDPILSLLCSYQRLLGCYVIITLAPRVVQRSVCAIEFCSCMAPAVQKDAIYPMTYFFPVLYIQSVGQRYMALAFSQMKKQI